MIIMSSSSRSSSGVCTPVAVKTLKNSAGPSELGDLLSEYQLLKDVNHPNVIKLLGACTRLPGPIYIIMEYCALGSLRSYLRSHRKEKLNKNNSGHEESGIQPKDILGFSWQIAKGMAYLTEMKLVHRDLAARNILLATGKVCKISDFGLTRDVYFDDTYLKRSRGRVPVKWMALESLSDHIYTTKTDVWSFGIVMWELVTLGSSPYPGIPVQNLYALLNQGYRMPKPTNCSQELYEIMRNCWMEKQSERPSFLSLKSKLEKMLEKNSDYLDCNINTVMNPSYFQEQQPNNNIINNIHFTMDLVELSSDSDNENDHILNENAAKYENELCGNNNNNNDTTYSVPKKICYDVPKNNAVVDSLKVEIESSEKG